MEILLYSLGVIVQIILKILIVLILSYFIVSWVGDPSNRIVQIINSIVDPLLKPLKPLSRKIPGPLDWTPVIALLIVYILYQILVPLLLKGSAGL